MVIMLHFVPVRYDEVFSKHTQGANILIGQNTHKVLTF